MTRCGLSQGPEEACWSLSSNVLLTTAGSPEPQECFLSRGKLALPALAAPGFLLLKDRQTLGVPSLTFPVSSFQYWAFSDIQTGRVLTKVTDEASGCCKLPQRQRAFLFAL